MELEKHHLYSMLKSLGKDDWVTGYLFTQCQVIIPEVTCYFQRENINFSEEGDGQLPLEPSDPT